MLIAALNFRTFRASLVGIAVLSGRSGEPARGHRRSRYDSALYLRRTPVASYEALRYRQTETGSVTWSANRSTRRIPRRARRVFARDWAGIRAGLGGCRLRRGKKRSGSPTMRSMRRGRTHFSRAVLESFRCLSAGSADEPSLIQISLLPPVSYFGGIARSVTEMVFQHLMFQRVECPSCPEQMAFHAVSNSLSSGVRFGKAY